MRGRFSPVWTRVLLLSSFYFCQAFLEEGPPAGLTADTCTGSSAGLPPSECNAWGALYDATVGTNWTQCRGSRPDPCRCATDYGKVTCSKDAAGNNHITGIALTSGGNAPPFGLSGTLPEELTNLTALTFLDLSFNEHLYGSTPSGISGLSALLRWP